MSDATFNTSFLFQLHGGTAVEGDGITFIIQGNSPTAPGPGGGGLGYGPDTPGGSGGIPNSIAVKFDTFNNAGEGLNSTGLYLDGASPTVPSVNLTGTGIDLHSQDTFLVKLSYDGTTLTETITDTTTQATFTTHYTVNIPAAVGGNVGYVGFGGGTGGNTAIQDIQAWIYTAQDADPASQAPAAGAVPAAVVALSPPPASSTAAPAAGAAAVAAVPLSSTPTASTAAVDTVLAQYPDAFLVSRGVIHHSGHKSHGAKNSNRGGSHASSSSLSHSNPTIHVVVSGSSTAKHRRSLS